jgi:hypothetical protein
MILFLMRTTSMRVDELSLVLRRGFNDIVLVPILPVLIIPVSQTLSNYL